MWGQIPNKPNKPTGRLITKSVYRNNFKEDFTKRVFYLVYLVYLIFIFFMNICSNTYNAKNANIAPFGGFAI